MTNHPDTEQITVEQTDVNQCASCGGNAHYNPTSGNLKCPFCGSETSIPTTTDNMIELDYARALIEHDHSWDEEMRVFSCESCGAETVLEKNKVADFCSFCGSSHIVKSEQHAGIKPTLIVPFQVAEEEAIEKFKQWIRKRYFAPRSLKVAYRLHKITGAYIPYWTFDSNTDSDYVVKVGNYYYETVTRTVYEDGKPRQVTEQVRKIRWHTESGHYSAFFDDVLVTASRNVANGLIEKVRPFNLQALIDYRQQYLSGFIAEHYSVPLQEGWGNAQQVIDNRIESGIQQQVHGDIVNVTHIDTDYQNITFKHLLLPLWISSFYFNDKVYRFLVNGQTGKVSGQAPVSVWKVLLCVIIAVAIVGIFLLFQD